MNSIPEIIEDIKQGRFVILVDDEDRENEGDIMIAAEHITPDAVNFMAVEARGLICLSLLPDQLDRLKIPLMVRDDSNGSPHKTAFTVSIEASQGVSTGISAADRALTIKVASDPLSTPQDVIMPGHVFPIRAQIGGVLKRAGHTEASVDLAKLAGLRSAAVICEIINLDGTMARLPDLKNFAARHHMKISSIEKLIQYRLENEMFVQKISTEPLKTAFGSDFLMHTFVNRLDGQEHWVISKGEVDPATPVLVRVQTENLVRDLFDGSEEGPLASSLKAIDAEGSGLLIYLRGPSMYGSEDQRDYGVGAQILRALGVCQLILITNTPTKRVGIKAFGLEIVEERPLEQK